MNAHHKLIEDTLEVILQQERFKNENLQLNLLEFGKNIQISDNYTIGIEVEYGNIIGELDLNIYEIPLMILDIYEMKGNLTYKARTKAKNQLNRASKIYIPKYFKHLVDKERLWIVTKESKKNTTPIIMRYR